MATVAESMPAPRPGLTAIALFLMVAMAATTDFSSAFADKRLNIRAALQDPALLFPMST